MLEIKGCLSSSWQVFPEAVQATLLAMQTVLINAPYYTNPRPLSQFCPQLKKCSSHTACRSSSRQVRTLYLLFNGEQSVFNAHFHWSKHSQRSGRGTLMSNPRINLVHADQFKGLADYWWRYSLYPIILKDQLSFSWISTCKSSVVAQGVRLFVDLCPCPG